MALAIVGLRRAVDALLDRIERIGRAGDASPAHGVDPLTDIARIDDTICGLVDELARIKVETDERIARLERWLDP